MNALTFDIDWAPDGVLESLRRTLQGHDVRATFLVTHQTDILADLRADGHQLGIHPNFGIGSSHGATTLSVIEYLLTIVQDANVMRTHGLVQSSRMLVEIASHFPQLELDLSLFTYRSQRCERTAFHFSPQYAPLYRLNYNWEDDIAFVDPDFVSSRFTRWGDEHIFDFHPIHIYLNSSNGSEYQRVKEYLGARQLSSARTTELDRFRNKGCGIRTYFDALLTSGMAFHLVNESTSLVPVV